MWKYVSRRLRDTFERSVGYLDKRGTTGVVNSSTNIKDEDPNAKPPCRLFCGRKCWSSFRSDYTNSKHWNFKDLHQSWISAITLSSALVLGWYTSQLIHLKNKYRPKENTSHFEINNLIPFIHPYIKHVNKDAITTINSKATIEKLISNFAPTVHLISNEHIDNKKESSNSSVSSNPDNSDSELGDVLNSIENKLGLAAIENGQHQEGLNLLRSAANRNHAPALYNLGLCHELGLGVEVDEKVAMGLYRAAAAMEHPGALYNLGIYYGQGRGGLPRDIATATRLLKLAAVQGQEDAIKALESLDIDLKSKITDEATWAVYDKGIAPVHTTLFVENVNYLKAMPNGSTVY